MAFETEWLVASDYVAFKCYGLHRIINTLQSCCCVKKCNSATIYHTNSLFKNIVNAALKTICILHR